MNKIIAIAVAVLAAFVLSGCEGADPVAVQPAEPGKGGKSGDKDVPVKLAAKRTAFKPTLLHDGSPFTCVKVTVTNQTTKQLEVNPLYFSLTDSTGIKHATADALGVAEGQIDTTTLAPKEKAVGTVCAKGKFRPKVVAFTNPLFSEVARAEVA